MSAEVNMKRVKQAALDLWGRMPNTPDEIAYLWAAVLQKQQLRYDLGLQAQEP